MDKKKKITIITIAIIILTSLLIVFLTNKKDISNDIEEIVIQEKDLIQEITLSDEIDEIEKDINLLNREIESIDNIFYELEKGLDEL